MKLEITPEPTDAERAAIAAALLQETTTQPRPWSDDGAHDCEEFVKP